MPYTVEQAQAKLEKLIDDARSGKEVLIRHGKMLVKLEAIKLPMARSGKRVPGLLERQGRMSSDAFDALTDEELKELGFE